MVASVSVTVQLSIKCAISASKACASKILLKLLAVLPPMRCKFLQYWSLHGGAAA